MLIKVVILFSSAVSVYAACDNQCSGHGTCLIDDVCNCYDNWGVGLSLDSGDCSDRICPFELAWVDTPSNDGRFHTYAECSNRGICDRKTGLCDCFDGYEGKACKRTSCPNDCSGHGTCEYIEDLAYKVTWNQYSTSDFRDSAATLPYYGWDKGKTRGCVCDSQYADIDCSKRMCPHGTDVLKVRDNLLVDEKSQIQEIWFAQDKFMKESYNSLVVPAGRSQTFALKFTSRLNESFVTTPIKFDYYNPDSANDFVTDVHLALLQLPHQVIDACTVSFVSGKSRSTTLDPEAFAYGIRIAFTGDAVQGPQNLIEVVDYECGVGCTPRITGLHNLGIRTTTTAIDGYSLLASNVTEYQLSDLNSYECGRRGKCDYKSGLCECFEGYTGENCNTQTTLV